MGWLRWDLMPSLDAVGIEPTERLPSIVFLLFQSSIWFVCEWNDLIVISPIFISSRFSFQYLNPGWVTMARSRPGLVRFPRDSIGYGTVAFPQGCHRSTRMCPAHRWLQPVNRISNWEKIDWKTRNGTLSIGDSMGRFGSNLNICGKETEAAGSEWAENGRINRIHGRPKIPLLYIWFHIQFPPTTGESNWKSFDFLSQDWGWAKGAFL